MKPKVSIVVPIYNVEPYLARCLDSLVGQRLRDIEIIAVNDGSTDGSGRIVRDYAASDARIVVIDQENGGVSSARNRGIEAARGEYIGFVDPDDWIDADMYERMYREAVQEDADIVMCTYIREFGTHSKEKRFPLPDKTRYVGEEVRSRIMRRLIGPLGEEIANPELLDAWGTVWSKLYRAAMIRDRRLAFVDLRRIGTNEDSLFNIQATYYAESFVFLNRPYYHYWRANAGSVTSGYKAELLQQWHALFGMIEDLLNEKALPEEFHAALRHRICLGAMGLGLNAISKDNPASALSKIRGLRRILNDGRVRRSFREFDTAVCSFPWRTFYFFAKHRVAIGYFVMLHAIELLRKAKR